MPTKLMTRLTYTLDEMSGSFKVDGSGNVQLKEEDGIDSAPVTVQLPGGERVPFLFSVKELEAKVGAAGRGEPGDAGGVGARGIRDSTRQGIVDGLRGRLLLRACSVHGEGAPGIQSGFAQRGSRQREGLLCRHWARLGPAAGRHAGSLARGLRGPELAD